MKTWCQLVWVLIVAACLVGSTAAQSPAPGDIAAPSTPTEPKPNVLQVTFVVRYRDQSALPGLMRALSDLRAAGQVSAIDPDSVPGRIFVLGQASPVLAMHEWPGVLAVERADDQTADEIDVTEANLRTAGQASATVPGSASGRIFVPDQAWPVLTMREWPDMRAAAAKPPALLPGALLAGYAPPWSEAGALTIRADGAITGVVIADDGGAPLDNVYVFAYQDSPYVYRGGYTAASGVYSISLPAGVYRVGFSPYDYHIPEYYDNVPYHMSSAATLVSVADGAVKPNINAGLAPGAQILGRVTDRVTSNPLPSISIQAHDNNYYVYASTDAGGVYTTAPGLPDGSYLVRFTDSSGVHASEYYTHAFHPSLATPVIVSGANRTDIDAAMSAAAFITGTVTGVGPLNGVGVYAYYADEYSSVSNSTTDLNGRYRLAGLAPIAYKVQFYDGAGQYISEWHHDKPSWYVADPITLTSGVTAAIDAQLVQAGVITGTVTAEGSGAPLNGISVTVYDAVSGDYKSGTNTNSSGTYRIGGLAGGDYKLQFYDSTGVYLTEYYEDKPSLDMADPIAVPSGVTVTIDAQLTQAGVITGTVTAEGGGAPLSGIGVTAYDAVSGNYRNSASTNSFGIYRIGGLAGGDYKLEFYDSSGVYLSEYYDSKPSFAMADPIAVPGGVTITIDAQLVRASVITGTVTAEGSGAPLNGVSVTAYDAASGSSKGNASTSVSGTYRIGGLAGGDYKLEFYDSSGVYLSEYYDSKPSFAMADPIAVPGGMTVTIDAQLVQASVITGTVTAEGSGAPLSGINVTAYDAVSGDYKNSASTNVSGTYYIGGLTGGDYKLQFSDSTGAYLTEYYEDKPGFDMADPIAIPSGAMVTIDAQLVRASVITGTVTAEGSGAPLGGIGVTAYDAVSGSSKGSASTDISGTYRIGGLAGRDYKLQFYDSSGVYLSEYYDSKPSFAMADPIAVPGGMTVTIDAQLARAGVIIGTVIAEGSGVPLSDIGVRAYNAASGDHIGSASTNISGTYRIGGLRAGDYKLRFRDDGGVYLTEYYDNKPSLDAANPIAVAHGMTTTADAALLAGGRIGGRVTDKDTGVGIAGVSVSASRQDADTSGGSATTDAEGYYTTTALYTGVYLVSFSPPKPYYAETFDNIKPNYGFTPVSVTAPLLRANINAALRAGFLITGTVTDSSGPVDSAYVGAYRGADSYDTAYAYTDSSGKYQLGPLDPGMYRVNFGGTGSHTGEWYNDSPGYAGATILNLTASSPNVNATLAAGARMTGTVTGSGGVPLPGVSVYVYPVESSYSVASGWTDAQGRYTTAPDLISGAYHVQFSAPGGYISEWYNDKSTQAVADVISVTVGVTRTNVNAQLASIAIGAITGTLTASDTGLPLNAWVYAYNPAGSSVASVYANGGKYVLRNLAPNVYRVYFSASSPYVARYYHHKLDLASAAPITVTAGITVADINQILPRGGAITGTVTGSGGVPGVYVYAQRTAGSYFTKGNYTGVDGGYYLDGIDAGTYIIRFTPPSPFIGEWYDNASSSSVAVTVSVEYNAVTPNVNAVLATGGVITGVVMAAGTSMPLPAAYANVDNVAGALVMDYIYADMDGRYKTRGLPAGDYKVQFDRGVWNLYLSEWYDGAPSFALAQTVTVPALGVTPAINATLEHGGTASGRIHNAVTGLPLSDVYADFYTAAGDYAFYAYSNRWGFYQTAGAKSGPYKVSFYRNKYWSHWYDGAPDSTSALTVTITAPNDTPNINANLYPYRFVYLPLTLRSFP